MMTDEEFLRITTYVKRRYGIDQGQKKVIVNGRLENYIKAGGWGSYTAFMDALEKDKSGKLEKDLLNMLTTNYTYFMREFEHFQFFKNQVLPWAKQKAEKTKDLRIWCGAASTGEEPYMIAMVIRDFFGLDHQSWDTKVLATDLSTRALQQAMAGVYNEEQLKNMPEQWIRHFFKKTGQGTYTVTNELKEEVLFRQFNLMSPFPFKKKMHTIFLRNVMIYFNVTAVAHKLEDIFYFLRESHPEHVPHLKLVEHVLEVADFISGEMDKIRSGSSADGDPAKILKRLNSFLETIKNGAGEDVEVPENVHEEPKQFYIAPVATEASNFFKVYITFSPDTVMANIHAYKIVYALKEIAEDLLYYPEDILSDEESGDNILKEGFRMLVQTQSSEEEIRELIGIGYDIKQVDIYECKAEEFLQGFDFGDPTAPPQTVPEPEAEKVEEKAEDEGTQAEEAPKPQKPQIAPGDFVIQSKEPGKHKKLAKDKHKNEKAAFISVNVTKMDQLMDLIGELVISESVVLQNPDLKVPGLNLANFNKAAAQMSKISTDLQNVIMSMRMVPLTNLFQKMNRIVFDVSRKLEKDIDFVMVGEHTEVDKNIIENISDPLMHLVRNAVDHGIETKEEYAESGKKERSTVTLSAKTEAGKVWISVTDNGKGMSRDKILSKARKQKLLDENKADSEYTDREVFQLVTLPGFSTNEQVTEYSGRGVGMDVVVQNIQAIGGTLEIESKEGFGTTMTLKIPLTLAIIDGIVMETEDSSFVVETGVIKEFVSVRENMMIHEPNGDEYIMIRGECYPVLRLGEWYGLKKCSKSVEDGMMLIFEVEGKTVCLFVDRLIGKQEIVVKPIPSYIKKVKGLSGCTQLGDGSIALILDPVGLIE